MYAAGKFQPMPSLPLPPPPSYESPNLGACPAVPGGNCMLTPYLAVPVFKEGWKDSPRPSIEPGPLGTEMAVGPTALLSAARQFGIKKAKLKKVSSHACTRGGQNLIAPFLILILLLLSKRPERLRLGVR